MFIHAGIRLFIISPYLSIYPKLRRIIEDADRRGVNIVVVYRRVDEDSDVIEWLSSLKHIYLGHSENLHAKYYAEDHVAIISSMNLYQYSQVNNEELGMIFDDKRDPDAFYDSFFFVQKIVEHSEPVFATIKAEFFDGRRMMRKIPDVRFESLNEPIDNRKNPSPTEEPKQEEITISGFCIRCGKKIDINSDIYYCEPCFVRWRQYNNPKYQEKYCHICGKPVQSSAYRPTCKDCYPGSSVLINKKKDNVLKDIKYQ